MNTYETMKIRHQNEVNAFPMVFAFSNEQFKEAMAQLGLKPDQTDKIYKFGDTGGIYLRSDGPKLFELLYRHEKELSDAIDSDPTGDRFVYDMFYYELANHEYTYTADVTDTVEALGFSMDEVNGNEKLRYALNKAAKDQRKKNGFSY